MKIIPASYEILTKISDGGVEELKLIEQIARICYKSSNLISEDGESAKKIIKALIKNHHDAMLEHSILTVKFTVNRAFSHELVRHRMASFAQESQRYCNYSQDKFDNEITFIEPCFLKQLNYGEDKYKAFDQYKDWKRAMEHAEDLYFIMLKNGCTPQEARAVLPNSTKTEIAISTNYREWRHILNLRAAGTTGKPSPEMLEVIVPLLKELKTKIPIIFDDIEVNE